MERINIKQQRLASCPTHGDSHGAVLSLRSDMATSRQYLTLECVVKSEHWRLYEPLPPASGLDPRTRNRRVEVRVTVVFDKGDICGPCRQCGINIFENESYTEHEAEWHTSKRAKIREELRTWWQEEEPWVPAGRKTPARGTNTQIAERLAAEVRDWRMQDIDFQNAKAYSRFKRGEDIRAAIGPNVLPTGMHEKRIECLRCERVFKVVMRRDQDTDRKVVKRCARCRWFDQRLASTQSDVGRTERSRR